MKSENLKRGITTLAAIIVAMAIGSPSFAGSFTFRVAFESMPGVSKIESGNYEAGFRILERALEKAADEDRGAILATLCGAYVMNMDLDNASRTCDAAVQVWPKDTAYNNRGVYRALTGDFAGASEDFDRVRPVPVKEYIEYLRSKDVRLIADTNHGLLQDLAARYTPADIQNTAAWNSASLEDVTR